MATLPGTPASRSAAIRRPYLMVGATVAAVTVVIGLVAFFLLRSWEGARNAPDTGAATGRGAAAAPASVTLFYVAEDGMGLVGYERGVPRGTDTTATARAIAEQQLAEAPHPLMSPFPDGTRLRSIYIAGDGTAFVDLSREVTIAHSGGSLDELFTVYAIVNALTTNVAEINAVQILVEGQEVDTLAGHVDLRQPLEPNTKWVVEPGGDDDDPPSEAG